MGACDGRWADEGDQVGGGVGGNGRERTPLKQDSPESLSQCELPGGKPMWGGDVDSVLYGNCAYEDRQEIWGHVWENRH